MNCYCRHFAILSRKIGRPESLLKLTLILVVVLPHMCKLSYTNSFIINANSYRHACTRVVPKGMIHIHIHMCPFTHAHIHKLTWSWKGLIPPPLVMGRMLLNSKDRRRSPSPAAKILTCQDLLEPASTKLLPSLSSWFCTDIYFETNFNSPICTTCESVAYLINDQHF